MEEDPKITIEKLKTKKYGQLFTLIQSKIHKIKNKKIFLIHFSHFIHVITELGWNTEEFEDYGPKILATKMWEKIEVINKDKISFEDVKLAHNTFLEGKNKKTFIFLNLILGI